MNICKLCLEFSVQTNLKTVAHSSKINTWATATTTTAATATGRSATPPSAAVAAIVVVVVVAVPPFYFSHFFFLQKFIWLSDFEPCMCVCVCLCQCLCADMRTRRQGDKEKEKEGAWGRCAKGARTHAYWNKVSTRIAYTQRGLQSKLNEYKPNKSNNQRPASGRGCVRGAWGRGRQSLA